MTMDVPWMEGINNLDYALASITTIAGTALIMVAGLLSYRRYRSDTMLWLFLVSLVLDILLIVEFVANLLASALLIRFAYSILLSAWLLASMMFVGRLFLSRHQASLVTLASITSAFIIVIMFHPETTITVSAGSYVINTDFAVVPFYIIPLVLLVSMTYSIYVIYRKSPYFLRGIARTMLALSILQLIACCIAGLLPYVVVVGLDAASSVIFVILLCMHPGLLTIVKYRSEYIVLLDATDHVVFDLWWTHHPTKQNNKGIKEALVASMFRLAAITRHQLDAGLVVEFEVEDGAYLICQDLPGFKLGLFTRASSRSLRDKIPRVLSQMRAIVEKSGANSGDLACILDHVLKTQMLDLRVV